ncbi:MAG: DUF58 domain-containing protein, partial [Streptosporangiales bacterium]|nr:DUF58 domain-containing protein [Streptosporangiales bacterium]
MRLVTLTVLALVLAFAFGHLELVVVAAPLAVLAAARRPPPGDVDVTVTCDEERCFENDPVTVEVTVHASAVVDQVGVELLAGDSTETDPDRPQLVAGTADAVVRWRHTCARWGRYRLGPVRVTLLAAGRAAGRTVTVPGPELVVYPVASRSQVGVVPERLPRRAGEHPVSIRGRGMEHIGVRPYVFGDRTRQINWPVTTRRGQLSVNEVADERATDLVVVIDALSDVGEPPYTSLDRSVRGAAGLAQGYLRRHDRVGAVAVGGTMRWLRPGLGARHLYQLVEAVLDVRSDPGVVDPNLDRIPRPALPPGALVVLFSPLLDERVLPVAADLRARGFPLVVVDVLATEPTPGRHVDADLAMRVWRMERGALHDGLAETG